MGFESGCQILSDLAAAGATVAAMVKDSDEGEEKWMDAGVGAVGENMSKRLMRPTCYQNLVWTASVMAAILVVVVMAVTRTVNSRVQPFIERPVVV